MLRMYLPSATFQAEPHLPRRCGTIRVIPRESFEGRWHDDGDELRAARGMMLGGLLGSIFWTALIFLTLRGLA